MNSKDLRNLAEAYQNIQEEPRPARRRKPNKTVEQIKAEIDARNPTQAGPQTGQRIPGAAPKLEVKPVPDPLPTRVQPPAPQPEFGPNAAKPTLYPKPTELRPGGQTPTPEFNVTQPKPNTGGATVIPRTNANTRVVQPPAPKPQFGTQVRQVAGTVSRGRQLMKNLRNLTLGGLATYGVAKGLEALDKGETKPTSGLTPEQQKSRSDAADQARRSGQMANIPPAEGMVNNPNYGKPGTVQPKTASKPLSAAAKDFDKTFAAKRAAGEKEFTWRGKKYTTKLKGEDADLFDIVKGHLMSEGLTEEEAFQKMVTMTEEERQSIVEAPIHPAEAAFNKSTPEERAANTKKYGTPYRPLDTSRRSGDPTAPAWMRGGFKSRDEYNKLDQATKDLLN